MNKKYVVQKTEQLEELGFKRTKKGYRKKIGNLKINVENDLMTVVQDNNKVFYLNSFEKLDLLIDRMINKDMICNIIV
nr:MAG TPA: hypothetical protein [Caudoviricetes sp.]